ncbi:pentapeptide repeat-containing protein [Streptomyces sp. TLI_185]|uniref:pentapeptide repeat-containing protein n=1 Tax=Streptomyces sp. TLI_185 TaxID=2485151 RepID=UPI000F4EFEF1|nr:pentapeptide repeat-containing protein [Streptomyces sp. TLI_185]RPF39327.1 pentapeptide repeat protein [Streptomyces sp. TLI_185]
MNAQLPRHGAERRGLRLWPVRRVLVLTIAAALATSSAAFIAGWKLLGVQGLAHEQHIGSQTLFDLVKLSFGVAAGVGALVALVNGYRRQRVDEDGALREATRLHTERFTTAVTQLGEESAAVRLGGVHALAGLADDAPTSGLRQTCIDVLCAYLRLPHSADADLPTDDAEARHGYLALREVRHTVIRLIRDHLRLEPEHPHSWQGHDFDLTAVTFDGGDLSAVNLSGGTVDFRGAQFSSGTVDFRGAQFSGGTVDFSSARFSGGTVDFSSARFSGGTVDFRGAQFSGGTVDFRRTRFSGSEVDFSRAQFSGSRVDFSGTLSYEGARFRSGEVSFSGAEFSGGTVDFRNAGGVAPIGLVPPGGSHLPSGVSLPSEWYPSRA